MSEFIKNEAYRLLCGRMIGEGQFRKVYICNFDPTLVVKVEEMAGNFSNVFEWELWHKHISKCDWAKKLYAPPVSISPSGAIMIQKRTKPATEFPDWTPSIWTDMKRTNYGMLEGRLVCHDFGHTSIPEVGLGEKMKVSLSHWWDENDFTEVAK